MRSHPRNEAAPAPFSLGDLAAPLGAAIRGDAGLMIRSVAPLDRAGADQLAFLSNPLYGPQAVTSRAGAIVVSSGDLEILSRQGHAETRSWLVAANPYAAFARIAQRFAALQARPVHPGVDPSASVGAGAIVPASCSIGPHVTIEAGATLGERVRIAANGFVGAGARIGDDTWVHANVTIHADCVIGARCILHSGAVIGADGFGFAPDFGPQGGEWVKIPQTGRAVIGHDVEIGANTTIDRGAMADTVIGQGCKIDNQVQIAHNVQVGAYTVIAGCAAISGSTRIGRHCVIGGAANFAGHLSIADRVTVSGGTSITKSIPQAGHFTSVFPFMPHADWERNAAIVRSLSRMRKRLQQLERQIEHLRQQS